MKRIIGIDIGGTKTAVLLGAADSTNCNIEILDKVKFHTDKSGPAHVLEKVKDAMELVLDHHNLSYSNIEGIGISCGGPLDSTNGVILSPPNLPGWDNVHIVKHFEDKYGIKTRVYNDANACALAEWKFGAARGCENVIFLTFGTGMGAGLILNGKLYRGTCDMAGEVGHIRLDRHGPAGFGKSGSFEGFCSGGGIAQLARTKVLEKIQMGEKVSFCDSIEKLERIDAKIVGDAAEAGDKLAEEIYLISAEYLGRGLSILIDIINPEIIVIGSVFARSSGLLWPKAQEVISREALSRSRAVCRIVPTGLGEKIGDLAALAAAVE